MRVAVAIVGYRNCEDVARCLRALEHSSHTDFEVAVCENGGAAAFDELAARLPSRLAGGQPVRIERATRNLGYAGGINRCLLAAAPADALWVLNPDTETAPEAMAIMAERLACGDCDAVGGPLVLPDGMVQTYGGIWQSWFARPVSVGEGDPAPCKVCKSVERQLSYLSGASMMVSQRFLATVGPMREDYFLYCEEVEWCIRARRRGMRLGYAPGARVLHFSGTTTGNAADHRKRSRASVFFLERNGLLLTRDCFPHRLPVALAVSFVLLFLRYARRGAWRQLGYGIAGWFNGVMNRRGVPAWAES